MTKNTAIVCLIVSVIMREEVIAVPVVKAVAGSVRCLTFPSSVPGT